METTTTIRRPNGVRHIPGFVDESLVAHVHRRAAEAALLRDRRLELAVDDSGHLHVRMVDGVRPASTTDGVRPASTLDGVRPGRSSHRRAGAATGRVSRTAKPCGPPVSTGFGLGSDGSM